MFAARFIARRSLAHSATVTSRRTFMQCSHVLQMPVKTIDVSYVVLHCSRCSLCMFVLLDLMECYFV